MRTRPAPQLVLLAAVIVTMLTGCTGLAGDSPLRPESAETLLTMRNAWVKAANDGMSAAFGELKNTGTEDVTIVSVTTAASNNLELHETVEDEAGQMIMRKKDNGFTIPPGETFMLEPGGNHIMLMDLINPIMAGNELTFTVTLSDGSTFEFNAPAKEYSGANENYEPAMNMNGTP
jgi:copper(I)-binding protein